jgi:uncharacterized membrane protein
MVWALMCITVLSFLVWVYHFFTAGGGLLMSQMTATLSPFPSEAWLLTAEELHPGTTAALVNDFVHERKHARAMDRRSARLDERSFDKFTSYQSAQLSWAGSIAGLVASGGIALAFTDHSTAGLAVLLGEITALVGVFLSSRSRDKQRVEQPQGAQLPERQ